MGKLPRKQVLKGSARPGWFTPIAVILILAGGAGAFLGFEALGKVPPNALTGYGGIGSLVVAIVVTLLLAAATKRQLRVDSRAIEMRTGFGKPVRIEWSEPHDYYYRAVTGESTPTVEKASVRTPDGRRIDVDDMNIAEHPNVHVPALVEQYSTAANWPKIEERLEKGEEVEFGAVQMSRKRIQLGELTQKIAGRVVLRIERGRLRIGSEGKWFSTQVAVRDVANYPCLLRAIGQTTQALPPS